MLVEVYKLKLVDDKYFQKEEMENLRNAWGREADISVVDDFIFFHYRV